MTRDDTGSLDRSGEGPGSEHRPAGLTGGPATGQSQLAELADLLRRNADFRKLFFASVVSFLGDWFALVAVAGLVEGITGSEGSTALVFASEVLPIFLFAPVAGMLADRFDRKRIMVSSAVLRTVPALGLLVAAATESAPLAYLCVASISMLAAFYEPIVGAVVPNVVDSEDLSLAQAAIGSVWGTMLFLGAAIGGVITWAFGREASFVVNAATFVVAAGLIVSIRRPFSEGQVRATASVLAHVTEVWRFVRPRKPVRALMITKAGVGVGNGIVGLLPIYALTVFEAGDLGTGVLLAMRGLGALVGPYVGRALYRDDGNKLVFWCGASIVTYALFYLLLPAAGARWIAAAVVGLAHVGGGNQWVASTTGLQVATPDQVRGRVMSLDFSLATLGIGLSSLVAAALAESIGLLGASLVLPGFSLVYGVLWLVWTRDLWRWGRPDPLAREAGVAS
ncbi:MAG: MFS transporter [Nitriliruptorales bacterium]|nr:MFS transporter [Nitriliruptorales bacterium]